MAKINLCKELKSKGKVPATFFCFTLSEYMEHIKKESDSYINKYVGDTKKKKKEVYGSAYLVDLWLKKPVSIKKSIKLCADFMHKKEMTWKNVTSHVKTMHDWFGFIINSNDLDCYLSLDKNDYTMKPLD